MRSVWPYIITKITLKSEKSYQNDHNLILSPGLLTCGTHMTVVFTNPPGIQSAEFIWQIPRRNHKDLAKSPSLASITGPVNCVSFWPLPKVVYTNWVSSLERSKWLESPEDKNECKNQLHYQQGRLGMHQWTLLLSN